MAGCKVSKKWFHHATFHLKMLFATILFDHVTAFESDNGMKVKFLSFCHFYIFNLPHFLIVCWFARQICILRVSPKMRQTPTLKRAYINPYRWLRVDLISESSLKWPDFICRCWFFIDDHHHTLPIMSARVESELNLFVGPVLISLSSNCRSPFNFLSYFACRSERAHASVRSSVYSLT